jgi:protein-S-isoprenylcysteine O-methyltransferase Ste14
MSAIAQSAIAKALRSNRMLDRIEQGLVLALYLSLVARLWPADFSSAHWYAILLLVSEGLVVALLLARRPTENISRRWGDWALGCAGTFTVLMVVPGGAPIHATLGLTLIMMGLVTHVGAKLSLWRSFGVVAANRGVKTRGLYRFVRHPMYAGYMLSHIGFLLAAPSWWNLGVYALGWALLIARIGAEERTLRQSADYQDYAGRVRWRLVPGIY